MSIKNKFKDFFYLDEYEEEQQTKQPRQQPAPRYEKVEAMPHEVRKAPKERRQKPADPTVPNLVSLQSASKSSKVSLVEPRVYSEAQDISEHLKNKRAVVVNLQRIEKDQGIRIIDFLSGTVYALGGDIQRIGTDIFLCVPDTVEVDGAISDYYYDDQQ
ncbi:cell division protein SepF [Planococcus salinus]|uniref:Cell division protein SepF n=1 Tax=Planococcus salinus TaxID=1848460 RepID=A0A3M8PBS6_9BACL|nr:cell division protein SepF [Planococcus salinus]RNF40670.1 cell division protein SepF [Planococcus salinus]